MQKYCLKAGVRRDGLLQLAVTNFVESILGRGQLGLSKQVQGLRGEVYRMYRRTQNEINYVSFKYQLNKGALCKYIEIYPQVTRVKGFLSLKCTVKLLLRCTAKLAYSVQ